MKLQIYAIHDSALEAFGALMLYTARGQALRDFNDQVNSKDSQLNKHPEDYRLMYIGDYDNATANITNHGDPIQAARAIDVIIRE